jgi:potassium efflux system protein
MRCSLTKSLWAGVLLALLLPAGGLAAQVPQETAAEQPPAVPELADLIPRAADLSERLAELRRTAEDQSDLSQFEQQLEALSIRMDADAQQLLQLKTSVGQRAGRLPELQEEIDGAGDALTQAGKPITEGVRTFARLRREWIAKRREWETWQAALREEAPLQEVITTVSRAQEDIDTALSLIRQRLERLLTLQEQASILQARAKVLDAEAGALLSLSGGGAAVKASPPMLSTDYLAQLATELRPGGLTRLVRLEWPGRAFFVQQGWILILQGMISLGLALVLYRHRNQLEQIEPWKLAARRPIAAGILVGVMAAAVLFERPPAMVLLAVNALVGFAFVRLVSGLVHGGWRRRFVYGLLTLLIMTNVCYVLGLALAAFRLYVAAAAVGGLLCCLRWAAESSRLRELRLYTWALRLAAALFAAVLFTELRGNAEFAEFLFISCLRTLGVLLAFALLRHLLRGGLEWVVQRSGTRGLPVVRSNVAAVVQRLSLLLDFLIGIVVLGVLLMVWRVYQGPADAIAGLLSLHLRIGSQELTLGLVLLALALLGSSYVVSWTFQNLLTDVLLVRRNVDVGVSISIARLLHYALVSLGYIVALVVLGVDLTKMTLLASALGVGIGFGLQTIVNNFVCGLILLLERPVRVGDTVEMGGEWVKITKIGLRSTTVRTLDQADVIVPNTDLVTNQVTNWTLTDRHARITIPVGVAYGSNVDRVIRTLKACALDHPEVLKSPEPEILFQNFGDSSLNFELRTWVKEVDNRLRVLSDLNQDIDRRFHETGIEIPFPQRDLHVRSVEKGGDQGPTLSSPSA